MAVLKRALLRVPVLGPWAQRVRRAFGTPTFTGSAAYWIRRYADGGDSGAGSSRELAAFKAEILNSYVHEHAIHSVIEFGCGDGNQLRLAQYPRYLGFDISLEAVRRCRQLFADDPTKEFRLADDYVNETAELTLSLDVVYHLVEDEIYAAYMRRLFVAATRAVAIYSSNLDREWLADAPHVRHREVTRWVNEHQPAWKLVRHVPNRYPYAGEGAVGSFADFFFFARVATPVVASP